MRYLYRRLEALWVKKIYIKGVNFSDSIITFAIPIEVLFPWNRNDLI